VRQLGAAIVCTDAYPAYADMIPKDRHYTGKDGTQAVEALNSRIRHFLARFRRRSKCYSKSVTMVTASLALFFFQKYVPILN
jgi:insertion element IS1 protein InsB